MGITSEDIERSLSNSPQLTFEIQKTDIHYLCKTNLGLLPLPSSERCFLARGWRRELLFPYNNAKTQTE